MQILTSNFERVAYESDQGEENPYQDRPFSADDLGRSATRTQNIGLRPLVQNSQDSQEFGDNKLGHETTASFNKTEGSSNRSSLVGHNAVMLLTFVYVHSSGLPYQNIHVM